MPPASMAGAPARKTGDIRRVPAREPTPAIEVDRARARAAAEPRTRTAARAAAGWGIPNRPMAGGLLPRERVPARVASAKAVPGRMTLRVTVELARVEQTRIATGLAARPRVAVAQDMSSTAVTVWTSMNASAAPTIATRPPPVKIETAGSFVLARRIWRLTARAVHPLHGVSTCVPSTELALRARKERAMQRR
jgi:hypothetical protein